ncbi:hypothetical protein ANN_02896 [Periplaneta americana]|uniref:Uncharacterized protein n=1 Tax=Periplaneta americana TaxID=6978 RepID=A0ABQ8TXK9_PERAM|nr:hypothetical protein ANN_02896 [Periplaneta americana]
MVQDLCRLSDPRPFCVLKDPAASEVISVGSNSKTPISRDRYSSRSPAPELLNRINASQMRFLRSLTGVTLRDRIRSEDIRNQWEVEEMTADVQHYQRKWRNYLLGCLKIVYQRYFCIIIHDDEEI